MNLYQISSEYQKLLIQLYDQETGEINMNIQAQIDALEPSAEKKCEGIVSYIKKIEAETNKIAYLRNQLEQREAAYFKKISQLENYLVSNMQRCNLTKIECPLFTINLKKNPYSTDILDEKSIPEKYMKTREIVKTETKPDKNAIKEEVLKSGIQVPGALVHQKTKLEILIDKI